ncbi:jg9189 [Pararge aegeria aegeria]|uniref:Jg9189 protein n=1 Tax=Pararge aegeria aegeria TaxID=348720 RepID=A0A8S4S9H8_9NEOP|nr:jg9189 [Pararge aegeria aegeria]
MAVKYQVGQPQKGNRQENDDDDMLCAVACTGYSARRYSGERECVCVEDPAAEGRGRSGLMAAVAVRTLLVTAALAALGDAGAARFGDRLAPRVPAPYSPRNAPSSRHFIENEDEDPFEQDYEDHQPIHQNEEQKEILPQPRRPTRTEAHRLEMSTEYFVIPERPSSAPTPSSTSRVVVASTSRPTNMTRPQIATPILRILRTESWAVPILALACVSMVVIGGFEGFIVWGASRKAPSQRHLLLGQCLLFGLFTCAATAALFTAAPTSFTCGAVRFGTGVAYVIVFASLLVKCVFLLSLNGGVYLPAAYQGLLLFFAVMIQVAIGAQWLGGSPPRVAIGAARCDSPLSDLLLSLCYAAFLIAVVCGVALRSRGIRDNYREATHIAGAGGATAAVWICWVSAALGAPEQHREACVAAGLLGTCAVVFALMFAPKGRRLAALGREGRWDADREEGLSSIGVGGSGYSPSFFHFKPVKYGMVTAAAPAPAPPTVLDRKEPSAQPADPYGGMFAGSHLHSRSLCPPHYPIHPLTHYHYNYPPYHYLLPPGVMMRPEEGNVYTSVEPTFSSNPNVYFQLNIFRESSGAKHAINNAYWTKRIEFPTCRACNEDVESMEHLLCECDGLARKRLDLLGVAYPQPENYCASNLKASIKLLEWIFEAI